MCKKNTEPSSNRLSDSEIETIYDEIMPEKPYERIIPIDTSDFIEDNNGNIIVAGLLNIAMVDGDSKFKRMAVDLKHAFPDETYKIVYYDEKTSRLQFNFPTDQNNTIKKNIKDKLAAYQLLMWDESVFETSKTSNDPFIYDNQKSWHWKNIQLEKAWDLTQGVPSVCIAIIDDGFDLNHLEFKGKTIIKPYNVLSKSAHVYGGSTNQHGTHVAALATGLSNNGFGSTGVAPKCSFMPVQIGGSATFFTSTDVIDGVLYAINNGADVINMSLGRSFGDGLQGKSPSQLEEIVNQTGKDEEAFWVELFKLAEDKNVSIVVAAGNENLLIGLDPMQRSNSILKVVAVDSKDQKARFSNYCKSCYGKPGFISAPGVKIWSAIPGNKFEAFDGTSMAAPIVSGAIALMKSLKPNLTNMQIQKILLETAKTSKDRSCPPIIQLDKTLQKVKNNI